MYNTSTRQRCAALVRVRVRARARARARVRGRVRVRGKIKVRARVRLCVYTRKYVSKLDPHELNVYKPETEVQNS